MQQTHVRLRIMLRGCRRLSFEYIFYECGRGPSSSMRKHCDSAMIWYNVHVLCIQYLVCKVTQALSACLIFGFVYIFLKGLWSDRAVWNILRNVLISIFHNPYLDFHISYSTFGFPYFIFHIWISIFIFHILISIFIFRIWISISRNIGWIWHWFIVSLLRIKSNHIDFVPLRPFIEFLNIFLRTCFIFLI